MFALWRQHYLHVQEFPEPSGDGDEVGAGQLLDEVEVGLGETEPELAGQAYDGSEVFDLTLLRFLLFGAATLFVLAFSGETAFLRSPRSVGVFSD